MGKHIFAWLIVSLLTIFLLPAVIPPAKYIKQIRYEHNDLAEQFGDESAQKIINSADEIFTAIFVDSGIQPGLMGNFSVETGEPDPLYNYSAKKTAPGNSNSPINYESKIKNYYQSVFFGFYEWILRSQQILMWATFAFPFLIAAVWDGIMARKVKAAMFSYTSPAIYNGMWHGLIGLLFASNLLFTMPFAIRPLIYPILITMFAILIRNMLANLQRSA